jgi:hypothetical protein
MTPVGAPDANNQLLVAAVDLIGRSGGQEFQIRYDDEQDPIVWVAVARIRGGSWECAGGKTPGEAAMRLVEQLIDGGYCAHCGRPAGVTDNWREEMPLAHVVCWHVFDPETEKFRRSCEGETTGRAFGMDADGNPVGRNDPCPCGSGQKWKRCHGA